MALNIFPREKKPAPLPEPESEAVVVAAPPEADEEDPDAPKKRARRGTRGGRGRGKARTEAASEAVDEGEAPPASDEVAPPPARRRSPRTRAGDEAPADRAKPVAERTAVREPGAAPGEEKPAGAPSRRARTTEPASRQAGRDAAEPGTASVLRAIDLQSQQIERLIRMHEDMAKRIGDGARLAAPPARVGVFVDAANVELAIDRLRTRIDWGKVLRMLTDGRQLVRAMAYSPIHDDPSVSIETQRFVEPFLDHGYKIVTKPLKRFADGTIKANVDIEIALDVVTMLDRLDIVCLVSGDGDFQRLVEVVQSRGVKVEVVGVGTSVAGNLRNAADTFIDLATRTRELKV